MFKNTTCSKRWYVTSWQKAALDREVPIRDETERDCAVYKCSTRDMKWIKLVHDEKWQNITLVVSRIGEFLEQINRVSSLALSDWYVFVINVIIIVIITFICLVFRVAMKLGLSLEVQQHIEVFLRKTCWNLRVMNNRRLDKIFKWGALPFLTFTLLLLSHRMNM